jgi:hypothetical protein
MGVKLGLSNRSMRILDNRILKKILGPTRKDVKGS